MKSTFQAALIIAWLATATLLAGCAQQEPPAPAADERAAAETATQEPGDEFSDGFESGDTASWADTDKTGAAAVEGTASEAETPDD